MLDLWTSFRACCFVRSIGSSLSCLLNIRPCAQKCHPRPGQIWLRLTSSGQGFLSGLTQFSKRSIAVLQHPKIQYTKSPKLKQSTASFTCSYPSPPKPSIGSNPFADAGRCVFTLKRRCQLRDVLAFALQLTSSSCQLAIVLMPLLRQLLRVLLQVWCRALSP